MAEVYRNFLLAIGACGLVVLFAYVMQKNKKATAQNPKYFALYHSTKYTAGQCRDIMKNKNIHDTFAYTLSYTPKGTEIIFTNYYPTQQIMETVFLLAFTQEEPAEFSLTFVREAFGSKEPVIPPVLLDEFFAQKLDATRIETGELVQ